MEIIGAVVIAVIAVWRAHVWRYRAEAARAEADALRAQRDEARRDADYHERLARDYRAGMEEHAAARLQAETALAAAASQRARDAQMIRHLEAEVARSRAAAEAYLPDVATPIKHRFASDLVQLNFAGACAPTEPRARGWTHETNSPNVPVEWYTPPRIFTALRLSFDLDVASPGAAVVPWIPAARHFTTHDNGLAQPWSGTVWMNPPYGPETPKWLHRFIAHGCGVALVFARTDTRWFAEVCRHAVTLCFLTGRVQFVRGRNGHSGGGAGSGSLLIGMGAAPRAAVRRCGLGVVFDTPYEEAAMPDDAAARVALPC